ncbi:hypothetical protein LLE49_24785 [Alicyclobacillus tolerans]|uniref:conjugal transfer protein TrbL family protein n=1 Tax=Alicyclobacillus tolerans TaxID=90970 RepID=UPI001F338B12|nr:conjugal transfer protein TrbL family protein [Alicyclobacillus tolerans]MCF8567944.1 hypothetical protein [Alicyclobacillus tolerans]
MSWLITQFDHMISNLVSGFVNDLLKFVVDILSSFLVNPINMNTLPGFSTLLMTIETLSTVALGVVVLKELMMNQYESFGDMDVSPVVILKNTFIAATLIWLSPLLVQQIILRLVVYLSVLVSQTLGSNLTVHLDTLLSLSTSTAAGAAAAYDAGLGTATNAAIDALIPDLGFWAVIIILLAFIVAFAIIGIQSGMRWAELYFLALLGPVLALSRASFSNTWGQWLRETIATAFSQLVQYFSTLLALMILTHPGTVDSANGASVSGAVKLLMVLGLLVFAISGPRVLRGLLSGGNPTGMRAVSSLARSAAGGLSIGG